MRAHGWAWVLSLGLLAAPRAAEADAVDDDFKLRIGVAIALDGMEAYPDLVFVITPASCTPDYPLADYAVGFAAGRGYLDDVVPCARQTVHALPRAEFPVDGSGKLPALDAMSREAREARLGRADTLRAQIPGSPHWSVRAGLALQTITDTYHVEVADEKLTLTPLRVGFKFYNGAALTRDFNKGRRPRIPTQSEVPEPPPDEPVSPSKVATDTTPATPPIAPTTPSAAVTPPTSPATTPSTTPPLAAPDTPAAAFEPETRHPDDPGPSLSPTTLALAGGCLLLAGVAGIALRRRK